MKTVITFGTFDLLHLGHIRILSRARALGDRLVVGVSTDSLNYKKKGFLPIFDQAARIEIVAALKMVDETFFEESLELKGDYISKYRADVLVMGHDWTGKFDGMKSICDVVYLPRTDGISTTEIRLDVVKQSLA